MSAVDLASLQHALQAHILDPSQPVPAAVGGTARVDRVRRVAIYSRSYRLRLIEALSTDFPALHALLGEAAFGEMANAYVTTHPSEHYSIRWIGRALPSFLDTAPTYAARPLLAQMARFEWTLALAFDAADEPLVSLAELALVPAVAWGDLRLRIHASVHRLVLGLKVPALWRAAKETGAAMEEDPGPETHWCLWRRDLRTYFRSLEPREAFAACLPADHTFAEICAELCTEMSETEVPGYVAGLLHGWVAEGTISRIDTGVTPSRETAR